jgi:hypothetical protein
MHIVFNSLYPLVYFLLGISPASEWVVPTFRNPLSGPSSKAWWTIWLYPLFNKNKILILVAAFCAVALNGGNARKCAVVWQVIRRRYVGERCVGECSCNTETGKTLDKERTQVYLLVSWLPLNLCDAWSIRTRSWRKIVSSKYGLRNLYFSVWTCICV